MAGASAADLLIAWVGRDSARVAHRGRVYAGSFPENALGPPEAAHSENRLLDTLREGGLHRIAQHQVALGDLNRLRAAGQCLGGLHDARLTRFEELHFAPA